MSKEFNNISTIRLTKISISKYYYDPVGKSIIISKIVFNMCLFVLFIIKFEIYEDTSSGISKAYKVLSSKEVESKSTISKANSTVLA